MTTTDGDRRSAAREERDGFDRGRTNRAVEREEATQSAGEDDEAPAAADRRQPGPLFGSDGADAGDQEQAATDRELLAPLFLAAAYAAVAGAVGPGLFDTGAGGAGSALAFGLLGTLLLLAGWSTARLYDDARGGPIGGTDWTPNPWHYILGGAVVPTAYVAGELVVRGAGIGRPIVTLAGVAIVAGSVSSIVAGPAYVLQRRRHRGSP